MGEKSLSKIVRVANGSTVKDVRDKVKNKYLTGKERYMKKIFLASTAPSCFMTKTLFDYRNNQLK